MTGYLPAGVFDADLFGVTVGAAGAFLNGHTSLYLGLLFVNVVRDVPNGL
jgi:branched-chain amino acid transport system permease protein